MTVSLSRDGFTESAIDNLRKLVDAKANLMRKALEADRLDIEITKDKVAFPWWDTLPEPEDTQAYTGFIAALYSMAKDAKQVLAKEAEVESEKYEFRYFFLRLGYVGNESKVARKTLLRDFSGHTSFRIKAEEEKVQGQPESQARRQSRAAGCRELISSGNRYSPSATPD